MVFFGALIMTKTLAGVSAGVIILWFVLPYLFRSKRNIGVFTIGIALLYIIVVPWYRYHLTTNTSFYQHHFINIGARNQTFTLDTLKNLTWEQPLFYLHMGVRKWYDPWILMYGVVNMVIIMRVIRVLRAIVKKKKSKEWQVLHAELGLIGWNIVILFPFLTTNLTEIWHLIPVYAPLSLIVAYGSWQLLSAGVWIGKKIPLHLFRTLPTNQTLTTAMYLVPFVVIAYLQIQTFYHEVFPATKYEVDEVAILKKAKKYNKTVYIDRDYVPIAVFYSEQRVKEQPRYADDIATIQNFADQQEEAVLVTKNSAVEQYTKAGFPVQLHGKNSSFSIIEVVRP